MNGSGLALAVTALALLALGWCSTIPAAASGVPAGPTAPDAMVSTGGGHGSGPGVVSGGPGASGVVAAAQSEGENETTRHEDPANASGEGDLASVSRWLQGELAERLAGSAINLSRGQYEQARAILGEEYTDRLDQLVDVAGETDDGSVQANGRVSDEERAATFRRARRIQSSLVDAVERFRTRLDRVREARASGNATRVRRLARTLVVPAGRVRENASSLRRLYGRLSKSPTANLTRANATVETVSENVSRRLTAIESAVFVGTTLSVRAANRSASFRDPLVISGRLRTENGTNVSAYSARFGVAGRYVRTTTDESGRFSLRLRPTALPTGRQTLSIAFAPANESRYLRATDSVEVIVEPTTPTVSVSGRPSTVGFADDLSVSGSVGADGVGATDVAVAVRLGDEPLGVVTTGEAGTFSLNTTVPAGVAVGTRTLDAGVARSDRAIAQANGTATVTVERTQTRISLDAGANGSERLDVDGRLETESGAAVGGQRLRVLVNGTVATTARTDAAGRFGATASVPGLAADNGTASVSVVYGADGTNLAPSRANATVRLGSAEGDGTGPGGDGSGPGGAGSGSILGGWLVPVVVAVLIGLLLAGGAVAYRWRRDESSGESAAGDPEDGDAVVSAPTPADADAVESARDGSPLSAARAQFEDGDTDAAVIAAYAAVRDALGPEHGVDADHTHRELYAAVAETMDDDRERSALRQVIDSYERAAFAQSPVSTERAERTLDRTAALLGDSGRTADD